MMGTMMDWQAWQQETLGLLRSIDRKVDTIMSEDATIAGEAAAEETSISAISGALSSIQALLVALQGETAPLSAATLAAAAQVQTDLGNLATTAQADETADQPPASPPAG